MWFSTKPSEIPYKPQKTIKTERKPHKPATTMSLAIRFLVLALELVALKSFLFSHFPLLRLPGRPVKRQDYGYIYIYLDTLYDVNSVLNRIFKFDVFVLPVHGLLRNGVIPWHWSLNFHYWRHPWGILLMSQLKDRLRARSSTSVSSDMATEKVEELFSASYLLHLVEVLDDDEISTKFCSIMSPWLTPVTDTLKHPNAIIISCSQGMGKEDDKITKL